MRSKKIQVSKNKKIFIALIYLLYLFIISAFGFLIYSYFTGNKHSELTLIDIFDPNFKNINDTIFQKTYNQTLPYILNPNTTKVHQEIPYSTNSYGFRDREYTIEKNTPRIIFLGDSFTFGYGLSSEQTFVKILENLLTNNYTNNNWEVMNFGISGYNTKWEVGLLEENGLKFSPDIVILMYYINDPDDDVENVSLGNNGMKITLKISNYFEGKLFNQTEKSEVEEFLIQQGIFNKFKSLKNTVCGYDYHCQIHYIPIFWNGVKDSFEKLDLLSKKYNFTVIVAILPNLNYLPMENYQFKEIHSLVSEEVKKHNFYVLDFLPILSKYPVKKLKLSDLDAHTSYYANQIIAITLKNYLQEENLMDQYKLNFNKNASLEIKKVHI